MQKNPQNKRKLYFMKKNVNKQLNCERKIECGTRIAVTLNADWITINQQTTKTKVISHIRLIIKTYFNEIINRKNMKTWAL